MVGEQRAASFQTSNYNRHSAGSRFFTRPARISKFDAPVEQVYPALVPFIELADVRVLVAADGADEIEPAQDGRRLRVVWKRWALIGGKPGQLVDPHITSTVVWRIDGNTLKREETLLSSENVYVRRWWFAVPTTASKQKVKEIGREHRARLESHDASLDVRVSADWALKVSLLTTGGGPLGMAARIDTAALSLRSGKFSSYSERSSALAYNA